MNAHPATTLHVVLPGDVDDPARTSGGNVYDRRVCDELAADVEVRELPVAGTWPHPGADALAELSRVLAAVPSGESVLLDGLVACGVPHVVAPHAERLRLTVLVHLPLGDEVGLAPAAAAELTERERVTLHLASAVVATSPWAAQRIAEVHGMAGAHVATPGADPAPLASPGDGSRLLCLGSVTPTKGQDLLVDALALVVGLDWTCRIVGPLVRDPAHVDALRASITRRRLDERVRLTGPRTGPELDATWAETDLLVLPSRTETYAMVVTEALARGVPVLAADVGGVAATLGRAADGSVPGLLVAPDNVAALGVALRRWLHDAVLRDAARRSALSRRAELDGWEVTARCLAKVLV